jgi:hypothetical protein
VQGCFEAANGYRLSPAQMRQVLRNPATGTASATPATDLIGVMPDLQAIIQGTLSVGFADVYLRDFAGDVGDPHTGSISTSPDIIVRPTSVADPQMAFGEGSVVQHLLDALDVPTVNPALTIVGESVTSWDGRSELVSEPIGDGNHDLAAAGQAYRPIFASSFVR